MTLPVCLVDWLWRLEERPSTRHDLLPRRCLLRRRPLIQNQQLPDPEALIRHELFVGLAIVALFLLVTVIVIVILGVGGEDAREAFEFDIELLSAFLSLTPPRALWSSQERQVVSRKSLTSSSGTRSASKPTTVSTSNLRGSRSASTAPRKEGVRKRGARQGARHGLAIAECALPWYRLSEDKEVRDSDGE